MVKLVKTLSLPQCGIKSQLNKGKISKTRYENYVKIYNELKEKEEHKW